MKPYFKFLKDNSWITASLLLIIILIVGCSSTTHQKAEASIDVDGNSSIKMHKVHFDGHDFIVTEKDVAYKYGNVHVIHAPSCPCGYQY